MSKAHREEANPPKPPGPSSGRGEIALDPSRTAVVCIECQNGVVGSSSILPALAAEASPVIVSIAELLRIARLAGALVVHAPYVGALGGAAESTPLMRTTAQATADWTADHHQTQIVRGLLATGDLIVPRHHGFSATLNTELLKILRGNGIESIIFAGVSLNVAIPVSVAHAAEEGFHVVVVREAVVGTPAEYGVQVLEYTIAMLASVISLSTLERHWARTAPVTVNRSTREPRRVK